MPTDLSLPFLTPTCNANSRFLRVLPRFFAGSSDELLCLQKKIKVCARCVHLSLRGSQYARYAARRFGWQVALPNDVLDRCDGQEQSHKDRRKRLEGVCDVEARAPTHYCRVVAIEYYQRNNGRADCTRTTRSTQSAPKMPLYPSLLNLRPTAKRCAAGVMARPR